MVKDEDLGSSFGERLGGGCRIRLRPDGPSPCSCSARIGDLTLLGLRQPCLSTLAGSAPLRCAAYLGASLLVPDTSSKVRREVGEFPERVAVGLGLCMVRLFGDRIVSDCATGGRCSG